MNPRLFILVISVYLISCIWAKNIDCESSPKPDFQATDRKISEQKCLEYNWERKNIEKCSTEPANIEYPYMGVVGYKLQDTYGLVFACSALIVSPKFVLTSSRCVKDDDGTFQPSSLIVRLGNGNIKADVPRVDAKVARVIPYTEGRSSIPDVDLGLIELENALTLTSSIQPACVWSQSGLQGITHGTAPGWTSTDANLISSDVINKRNLEVLSEENCSLYEKYHRFLIKDKTICTNGTLTNLCPGTAGNPLIAEVDLEGEDKMPYAFGMSNLAIDCSGESLRPFTRLSSYIDWIEQIVWPNEHSL